MSWAAVRLTLRDSCLVGVFLSAPNVLRHASLISCEIIHLLHFEYAVSETAQHILIHVLGRIISCKKYSSCPSRFLQMEGATGPRSCS